MTYSPNRSELQRRQNETGQHGDEHLQQTKSATFGFRLACWSSQLAVHQSVRSLGVYDHHRNCLHRQSDPEFPIYDRPSIKTG